MPAGTPIEDVGDAVLMPGLVDTHVHVNEPGRTEWEGFETATRAAAAGGVTTLVDMPLNSIPATTTRDALDAQARGAAAGSCSSTAASGAASSPATPGELDALADAGVLGFKASSCHSGVDEFPHVERGAICARRCRSWRELGVPLLVARRARRSDLERPPRDGDPRRYAT